MDSRDGGVWHWRYCLTKELVDSEVFYAIREVYESGGNLISWTENPIAARGDSSYEVVDALRLMVEAAEGPVLDLTLDPPAFVDVSPEAGVFWCPVCGHQGVPSEASEHAHRHWDERQGGLDG